MSYMVEQAIKSWRSCREEFELYRESAYAAAENATNGVLINKRGKAAGIDPYSLFIGNGARARAYASRELLDHWDRSPRITFEQFERQWMEQR